jgi:hypothetical protein
MKMLRDSGNPLDVSCQRCSHRAMVRVRTIAADAARHRGAEAAFTTTPTTALVVGSGGWFGDSEGHSDAVRRRWEDDDRGSSRSRGTRG